MGDLFGILILLLLLAVGAYVGHEVAIWLLPSRVVAQYLAGLAGGVISILSLMYAVDA